MAADLGDRPGFAGAGPCVVAAVVDGPVNAASEQRVLDASGWPGRGAPRDHGRGSAGGRAAANGFGQVGASLRFEGIVRRREPRAAEGGASSGDLIALDYQTYDPMAERQLLLLGRDVAARHGLLALAALHSRGRVGVGEASFVLIVESAHRAEALAAMADFIDQLKRDVPIWKHPVWH